MTKPLSSKTLLPFFCLFSSVFGFWQRCQDNATLGLVVCTRNDTEAMVNETSVTTLKDCYFKNCPTLNVLTETHFINVTFDGSWYDGNSHFHGGAVGVWTKASMTNCTVKNAYAPDTYGAAMYVDFSGNLTAKYTRFENNTARVGSAFANRGYTHFENVDFYHNQMRRPEGAGCDIFSGSGRVHWINGTSIWDPTITTDESGGGSLWIQNNTDTYVENVSIIGAVNMGIVTLSATVVAKNLSLYNSTSIWSGCFYASFEGGNITCIDCLCKNSTTPYGGGASSSDTLGVVQLINSTVEDVYSTTDTYGVCSGHFGNGWLMAKNTVYKNCWSLSGTSLGGAIYAEGRLELDNVTVLNSNSTYGGAVYSASNTDNTRIINSKFYGNNATSKGGAIYLYTNTELAHLDIRKNKADTVGGGIYITGMGTHQVNVTGPLTVEENVAGINGGGIFMDKMGRLNIAADVNIRQNQLDSDGSVKGEGLGSAIYLNQKRMYGRDGWVTVRNNGSVEPAIRVSGTVWVQDVYFGSSLQASNIFTKFGNPQTNGSVALVYFKSDLKQVTGKTLDFAGRIPDIEVQVQDLFGNVIQEVNVYDPLIIAAKLVDVTDNNTYLIGESAKGILNTTSGSVIFNGMAISTQQDKAKIMFYPLSVTGKNLDFLQRNLTFSIAACKNDSVQRLVPTSLDRKGRMQYICLPAMQVDTSLRQGLVSLAIICLVISLALGAFSYRCRYVSIYKATSPFFTNIITFGCIIQLASIIPQISANSVQCMLREWLEFLGFAISIGGIIFKTNRIKIIFTQSARSTKSNFTNMGQLPRLSIILVLVLVFLIVWQALRPTLIAEIHVYPPQGWIQTDACWHPGDPNNYFATTSVIMHIILEIVAAYLAYGVRNVPSQFNESKTTGLITYNWILFGGILYPLAMFLPVPPNVSFAFNILRVLIPCFGTMIILHVFKAYMIVFNFEAANQKLSTGLHSNQRPPSNVAPRASASTKPAGGLIRASTANSQDKRSSTNSNNQGKSDTEKVDA